ncbi:MAG: polyprenyl synthetase family protein, partial [Alphaproteobacteria bacterium]|nr:polyprenyl synthetase family protein [Alphaproteobacteria bacterium]
VSTLGKEEARQRAQMLINQAVRHLKIFENRADILKELAHYVLKRRA